MAVRQVASDGISSKTKDDDEAIVGNQGMANGGLAQLNTQQVALQNTQQQKIMEQQAAMIVSLQEGDMPSKRGTEGGGGCTEGGT
jgi:hypothetical protein